MSWYTRRLKRYSRLEGEIKSYKTDLARRISEEKAKNLLVDAEEALKRGHIDEGWKCFQAARRMEIFVLTNAELIIKAKVLREESGKLSSWRKKAIGKLLDHIECQREDINPECVYQASLIRDEHYDNQAYKDALLRTHIIVLVVILFFIVPVFPLLLWLEWIPSSGYALYPNLGWKMSLAVALFGLLGGTISAILSVPRTTQSSRIPELVHTIRLTILRVFMGAASALIIYVFLTSQLRQPLEKVFTFLDFEKVGIYTIYAISIVAGFSERFVLRAMEFVSKEKKEKA